jgi:hypothetical protein
MRSEQPEVNVKMSSEVETLPTTTTNYNVRNDHRKIEAKNPDIFVKLKNPPSTNLKPKKEDMSWKTRTYGNPTLP